MCFTKKLAKTAGWKLIHFLLIYLFQIFVELTQSPDIYLIHSTICIKTLL